MKKVLSASVLAALLVSCASTQKSARKDLDMNLQIGNTEQAIVMATDKADLDVEKNELGNQLWGMQSASLYRLTKQYDQSNKFFDLIEDVMYQEDTESVLAEGAETFGSMLTNDSFLDYEQTMYDSIMVNTYKALNFTALGDFENARVEWNRSDDRQRRAADYFAEKINGKKEEIAKEAEKEKEESGQDIDENVDKSLSQSEKLLAEQGIDMSGWKAYEGYVNPFSTFMHGLFFMLTAQDKADVNKAVDSFKRVEGITNASAASQTLSLAKDVLNGRKSKDNLNKVWVIFENGRAAVKEEMRIDLPLFLVSGNVSYVGMALPKIEEQHDYFNTLRIGNAETEVIADMDRIIKAEFKEEFPLILTREITRATAKTIIQKQLNDENPLLGLGASLLQYATTSADLRTWSLLPKNFQAAVVDAPSDNQLIIESQGFAQPITVDIESGKNSIVYVRAVNNTMVPSVEVITL